MITGTWGGVAVGPAETQQRGWILRDVPGDRADLRVELWGQGNRLMRTYELRDVVRGRHDVRLEPAERR